jgi:hypothetical protein
MKSHRTDKVSLVFALVFLVVAGWWLLAQTLELTLPAVGWFVAGGLILFGLLGLVGALRSARAEPTPAVPPASVSPAPFSVSPAAMSPAPPAAVSPAAPGSPAPTRERPPDER